MLGERKCYLCGGNLVGGRCVLCGLDNGKRDRKRYRLNETSMKRVIREIEDGHSRDDSRKLRKMQSRSSTEKKRKAWVSESTSKKGHRSGSQPGRSKGGNPKVGIVIFLIILLFNILPVIIGFLAGIFSMVTDGAEEIFSSDSGKYEYEMEEGIYMD